MIKDYPNTIFFGTKFIFDHDNILMQTLYNRIAYIIQRKIHLKGKTMVVLPINIDLSKNMIITFEDELFFQYIHISEKFLIKNYNIARGI